MNGEEQNKPPITLEELTKQTEHLRNPHYLPTRQEVLNAIPSRVRWGQYIEHTEGTIKWSTLFQPDDAPIFEIWTKEYIKSLAAHLHDKLNRYPSQKVLEVGAGNGRLSYLLREYGKILNIAACDPFQGNPNEWKIKPLFHVEEIGYKKALVVHEPSIIICAWMPPDQDWTQDFRNTPSVQEYIVIGDVMGACGDPWLTFGVHDGRKKNIPPYKQDGFTEHILQCSNLQIAHYDDPDKLRKGLGYSSSKTISFQKM